MKCYTMMRNENEKIQFILWSFMVVHFIRPMLCFFFLEAKKKKIHVFCAIKVALNSPWMVVMMTFDEINIIPSCISMIFFL